MVDLTVHKFIPQWLKENLDGYQFLTPDAMQLRSAMASNPLAAEEDYRAFGELYERFLLLIEFNPFLGTTKNGEKAAILAKDFYFYLYPTKQGIYLPIGLHLEIGAADSEQDAKEFGGRLRGTLDQWEKEFGARQAKGKRLPDSVQGNVDLQALLNKSPSHLSWLVSQILLLLLIALCAFGLFTQVHTGGTDIFRPQSLDGIARICVAVASAAYLLKSLAWLTREKKRTQYLKAWKMKLKLVEDSEAEQPVTGFRTPELAETLIDKIEARTYQKPTGFTAGSLPASLESAVSDANLEDLSDEKKQKIFQTARPVHVLAMLMAAICLLTASPLDDWMPQAVGTVRTQAQDAVDLALLMLDSALTGSQEENNIRSSVHVQLVVTADSLSGHSDLNAEEGIVSYEKGTVLEMSGCETDDLGDLCYYVSDGSGTLSYVSASGASLKAANGFTIASARLLSSDGQEKESEDLRNLFDGSPLSGTVLETGDIIEIVFTDTVSPEGIYVINGSMEEISSTSGGVRLAYLSLDDAEGCRILFDTQCDTNGYAVALTGESFQTARFQVVSTTDGANDCSVSEILFCG
ncbi:MAG: hypothetical protein LUF35_08725 [Lachnospiraceae bacterium]|nr:hypothetical protein [Lachnospiraceae bacterium]